MIHIRSREEIADLPIYLPDQSGVPNISDLGTIAKVGDIPKLVGAIDVGSFLNIQGVRVDCWVNHYTFTVIPDEFGPGESGGHYAFGPQTRLSRDFDWSQFALLQPIYDYSTFDFPFGTAFHKTYADASERHNDHTLTSDLVGLLFKQASDETYWILDHMSQGQPVWVELLHPPRNLSAVQAFLLGDNVKIPASGSSFSIVQAPMLFLGSNYDTATRKFTDAQDADFPTCYQSDLSSILDQVGLGGPFQFYRRPWEPALTTPTTVFEALGRLLKYTSANDLTFFPHVGAWPRAHIGDLYWAIAGMDGNWSGVDATPTKVFPDPDHPFSTMVRPYSWWSSLHDWNSSDFASLPIDDAPYDSSLVVNAGAESHFTQNLFIPDGSGNSFEGVEAGTYFEILMWLKFDMGEQAQAYPVPVPLDPSRYIRDVHVRV